MKFGRNGEKSGFNFLVGPSLGYCALVGYSTTDEYSNSKGQKSKDSSSGSSGTNGTVVLDLGINAGMEGAIKVGRGFLFDDLRFQTALIYAGGEGGLLNYGLQVVTGYRIPFGK